MKISNYSGFVLGLLLLTVMGACKKENGGTAGPVYDKNYYGRESFVIGLGSNYQEFDSALKYSGYIDTLAQPGPFTTFLMDHNAIYQWVGGFPSNLDFQLGSLIIKGDYVLKSLPFGRNQRLPALAGNHLYLSKYPLGADSASYMVNGMPVYTADIPATNGHINVLDQKLTNFEQYSSVVSYVRGSHELTFVSLILQRTGLDKMLADTTKNWTLLAPVDAAFKSSTNIHLNNYDSVLTADTAMLANLVRYHILPDRYFYNEFVNAVSAASNQTTTLTTLLPNDPVTFYYSNAWPNSGYFFIGPGNTTGALIYSPTYGVNLQDNLTVNGVVHEISNILLP